MNIKRILAATDFSPCSRAALEYAIEIARRFGARVDVLNVWQLPINVLPDWIIQAPGDSPQPITNLVRRRAAAEMDDLVSELRREYDNVHGCLELGDPDQQIVDVAKREDYGLIVMGTHGRTGLSHLWMGSVAEKVVRRATCPVLTVRSAEKGHE